MKQDEELGAETTESAGNMGQLKKGICSTCVIRSLG